MTVIGILMLLLVAFIAARLYRSTKIWWACVFAIVAGLLIGMVGKNVMGSNNEPIACTQPISTEDGVDSADMQSLVATVTEGTTTASQGLQVITAESIGTASGALVGQYLLKGRDSPEIEDSS